MAAEPIRLPARAELELRLRENPGTGWVWRWSCEPEEAIEEVEITFAGSSDTQIGGETTRNLVLRAVVPGRVLLELRHAPPWLQEDPAGETVQLTLDVEA